MKTILLIGSSGGIGNTVAQVLLNAGYKVIGTYFKPIEKIKNLEDKENFSYTQLDVRDINSIKKLFQFVKKETTKLYGVINCSGIVNYENGKLDDDFNVWQNTIATNLSGNFYLSKIFYELLESNGRFIMISSTDAYFGGAITASYSASKAGVNSLTKSLSLAFKDKKIRVNSIAPGWVETPMAEVNGRDFLNKVAGINPLKRNAKPDDVAKMIKFLLSDDSSYLNGQVISLEGGYTNQDPTLMLEEEVQS